MDTQITRTPRKRRKGQGLVEFALIAPLLLLVIFAVIDFGWIAFCFSQINNAMREAVRYASVPGFGSPTQTENCAGIAKRLVDMAGWTGIKASDITIYYDDGRPTELTSAPNVVGTSQVGTCPTSGNFTFNTNYRDIDGIARSSAQLRNDDRVIIKFVDYKLRFLTPLIRTFAPNGVLVNLTVARSIFPSGETTVAS